MSHKAAKRDRKVVFLNPRHGRPVAVETREEHQRRVDGAHERELQDLGRKISSQQQLDLLAARAEPGARKQVYEALAACVTQFTPDPYDYEPMADCARCGFRRGSVMPHACSPDPQAA